MESRLQVLIAAILLGSCALSGCGGGGSSSTSLTTSPSASFSASSLTFGNEVEGTTSEPLLITLTNTGTAALTITTIAASANFAETNNCGSSLAAGANCAINVTLAPDTTGGVTGTVTFTDDATDSPQTVSLSGTAVTASTLTGVCVQPANNREGQVCAASENHPGCPVGQPAVNPTTDETALCAGNPYIDLSTHCLAPGDSRPLGSCQATSTVVSCSVQGQQCGAAGDSPCCSGFTCTAGSDGSSCQPAAGAASKARSSWDRGLADMLR